MEKDNEIFVKGGFYCKNEHLNLNLLEQDVNLPCSRVVNGFRIFPLFTPKHKVCFNIIPNNSYHLFSFVSLSKAMDFAKSFRNRHSDSFWTKQFFKLNTYCSVCSFLDDKKYFLLFPSEYNPDCPYIPKSWLHSI